MIHLHAADIALELAPTVGGSVVSLRYRGQGWQHPWEVATASADTATLVFEHPGNDWPWPYRATQAFQVQPVES